MKPEEERGATRGRDFMPQLDGLRAFAVGAVMVHHQLDTEALSVPSPLSFGLLGVRLFFVLSGFLITGILLKGRDAVYHLLIPGVFGPVLGIVGLTLAPKGVAECLVYGPDGRRRGHLLEAVRASDQPAQAAIRG